MFVALTKKLRLYQNTTSYFPVLYGSILVNVKRLFDEQMVCHYCFYSNLQYLIKHFF